MPRFYVPLRGSISPEVLTDLETAGLQPTGVSHRADHRHGFGAWVEAPDAAAATLIARAAIKGLPLGMDGEPLQP